VKYGKTQHASTYRPGLPREERVFTVWHMMSYRTPLCRLKKPIVEVAESLPEGAVACRYCDDALREKGQEEARRVARKVRPLVYSPLHKFEDS
jgi:hypothetical protein